jgi:hypothetical protein
MPKEGVMKKLCGLACLFTVLLGGALVAPLPSEAATTPSLKLKVDSGTAVELIQTTPATAATACTSTEIAAGYNLCYRLKTGAVSYATGGSPSRTYQITGVTTGSTLVPSLLVADKASSSNTISDKATVTGLQISSTTSDWTCGTTNHTAPCPNALETHVLTLTLTQTFDFVNNAAGATYQLPMVANANFVPGPSGTPPIPQPAWTVGTDGITLDGTIKVDTSGTLKSMTAGWTNNNLSPNPTTGPLKWQYGGTASGAQYYSLQQTPNNKGPDGNTNWYPNWPNCSTGNNFCDPTITATYTVTLYGPDTAQLLSSNDFVGGGCDQTNNAGGTLTPQGPPCFSNSKKTKGETDTITQQISQINTNNVSASQAAGGVAGTQCVTNCPCYDPVTCTGTIVIQATVTPAIALTPGFPFSATGPNIALPPDPAYSFFIPTDANGFGSQTFPGLFVGNLTAPWTFVANAGSASWPVADSQHEYDVDSIGCTSLLNQPAVIDPTTGQVISPAVIVSAWTVDSGSLKTTATVTELGKGDTVTCAFHIHKNSIGSK